MKSLQKAVLILALAGAPLALTGGAQIFMAPSPTVPMELPAIEMTMADMVDILTEYSIEHQDMVGGGRHWGLTRLDIRRIWLSDEPDLAYRRMGVIHEFLHVYYFRLGYVTGSPEGEAAIEQKTTELAIKLFKK